MSRLDRSDEFSDTVFTRDRRAWWAGMDVPGVNVTTAERLTVRQAFDQYLPWEIRKVNLYDPETFEATGIYGLKRSDTGKILGTGKEGYTVVQNAEMRDLLEEALDGAGYAVASIGALVHGAVTFISVDFDDVPSVNAAGQEIHPFYSMVNGNNGAASLLNYASGIRPECMNTIDLGWLTGIQFARLRHTASITERLKAVQQDVRAYFGLPEKAERVVRRLIDTRVDPMAYRRAVELATPIPEPKVKDGKVTNQRAVTIGETNREKMLDLAFNDDRVGYNGTVWGLMQTFSTFDQWESRFRRTPSSGATTPQHRTLEKLFAGEQATQDANRLALILRATGVDGVDLQKGRLVLT
ncbi:MAG: DUF932 domain-containing protein [Microthrixaceae bacterium]